MVDLFTLEISFLPNGTGRTISMGRKCKNLHFSVNILSPHQKKTKKKKNPVIITSTAQKSQNV